MKKSKRICKDLADYYKADSSRWQKNLFELGNSYCLYMGLYKMGGTWNTQYQAIKLVHNEIAPGKVLDTRNIFRWNDADERTVEEVIDLLERIAVS